MADKRITDLPPAGDPVEGNVYPVVQGTATVKQTLSQLRTAIGRVVSSLVSLSGAANKLPYYTGADQLALTDLTAQGRALLDDTSFTAMLNTLNSDTAVTLASAATVNIGAAASPFVTIAGTTTISAFSAAAAGITKDLIFSGSLALTQNATSLILPGGADIVTGSGDSARAVSMGGGNWKVYNYVRASGKPIAFAYDRSNALGAVTQVSGTPTGAIAERGSNANGEYVKYADGRLECKLVQTASVAVTTASGSSWIGAAPAWTYPVPFLGATPWVDCKAFATGRVTGSGQATATLTSAQSALIDFAGSSTNTYTLTYLAIGRWF